MILTMCSESSLMHFLLGNFVRALKAKNVKNRSLLKQNIFWGKKIPAIAEPEKHGTLLIAPRTGKLRDLLDTLDPKDETLTIQV